MTKKKTADESIGLPPENKERVTQLAQDVIEPALRKAISDSKGEATDIEILSAVATAYGAMLVNLLGNKAAASYMRGQADHIELLEASAPTNGVD